MRAFFLGFVVVVNSGAILSADICSSTIKSGWVMHMQHHFNKDFKGNDRFVKVDLDYFGMPRSTCADIFVRRDLSFDRCYSPALPR